MIGVTVTGIHKNSFLRDFRVAKKPSIKKHNLLHFFVKRKKVQNLITPKQLKGCFEIQISSQFLKSETIFLPINPIDHNIFLNLLSGFISSVIQVEKSCKCSYR